MGQQKKWLVLSGAALIAAASCKDGQRAAPLPQGGFVAFVGVGADDPAWSVLSATALRLHAEIGLSKIMVRVEAPAQRSVNEQKELLLRLRGGGMAAACVQVTDPNALAGTLDQLSGQGVQVITMLRPVVSKTPLVHCGADEALVGAAIADALNEALGDRNTIAVIHADGAGGTFAKRHQGFVDRLTSFPARKILLQFDCGDDPHEARRFIRETMERYPRLGGWALMGPWAIREPDDAHPLVPETCRIVCADPLPAVWPDIEAGRVSAAVGIDYDKIAERALSAGTAAAMGVAEMPSSYFAPPRTVTAANLNAFKADWATWASSLPTTAR